MKLGQNLDKNVEIAHFCEKFPTEVKLSISWGSKF